jgi:hypothetical protein
VSYLRAIESQDTRRQSTTATDTRSSSANRRASATVPDPHHRRARGRKTFLKFNSKAEVVVR